MARPSPGTSAITDWSKMKYKRFIDAVGGWPAFQGLLRALSTPWHRKHGVSIANVATRWVLEHPAVAGVIIGARLGEREHRADNLRLFDFALDAADQSAIDDALEAMAPIPGDCGDEYRKPPFLTASGDLSHHLSRCCRRSIGRHRCPAGPTAVRIDTGSVWEPIAGYSRAVRIGNRILVSGTTATHGAGRSSAPAIRPAKPSTSSTRSPPASWRSAAVWRTSCAPASTCATRRMWEEVARVHGRVLGAIRPANTLIECSGLIGDYDVEIEAEAEVTS